LAAADRLRARRGPAAGVAVHARRYATRDRHHAADRQPRITGREAAHRGNPPPLADDPVRARSDDRLNPQLDLGPWRRSRVIDLRFVELVIEAIEMVEKARRVIARRL